MEIPNKIIICQKCGAEFLAKRKTRKFCSNKCKGADLRDRRRVFYLKKCLQCGREFKTNKSFQKYCNSKCRDEWYIRIYKEIYRPRRKKKNRMIYAQNKEEIKANIRASYQRHRKKRIKQKLEYKRANKEKYNRQSRRHYRENPAMRIDASIRSQIRRSIKDKNGRSWELLVGYSIWDLMNHLEEQFQPGMTWANYGEWQIDHKIPRNFFNYESYTDKAFQECWSLTNLQPLWAIDNIRKGDKIDGDTLLHVY